MSERKNLKFINIFPDIHSNTSLEKRFTEGEFVTQKEVRDFANNILNKLNKTSDPKEQQLLIIELLRDEEIMRVAEAKFKLEFPELYNSPGIDSEKEQTEMKKMVHDSIVAIRKQVVEILRRDISPELVFFITNYLGQGSFSNQMIVQGYNKNDQFVKTYTSYLGYGNFSNTFLDNLETLKSAFAKLDDPDQMPYVIQPTNIDRENKNREPLGIPKFMVPKKDLVDIMYLTRNEQNEFNLHDILQAVIDCLKGAKFLAENNLVLTDISPRNIGVDKKTKKGILFDLDCILKEGDEIDILIEPEIAETTEHTPPEYRGLATNGAKIFATAKSMIWELGHSLGWISNVLIKKNNKYTEMHKNAFSEIQSKMTAENPNDRPDFDTCIAELTKIVEENFKEEAATKTPAV